MILGLPDHQRLGPSAGLHVDGTQPAAEADRSAIEEGGDVGQPAPGLARGAPGSAPGTDSGLTLPRAYKHTDNRENVKTRNHLFYGAAGIIGHEPPPKKKPRLVFILRPARPLSASLEVGCGPTGNWPLFHH